MIKLILNSSPFTENREFNPANHYKETLLKHWGNDPNILYIASFPDAYEITDEYYQAFLKGYRDAGFVFHARLLDYRNLYEFDSLFKEADIIYLPGGHTPTEMRFFNELKLKDRLKNFNGLIIGTSAGSMNMAKTVYAPPELEGETKDPNYKKYFEGLGLTDLNILPHHFEYKDAIVDGINVYDEIVLKDSMNHKFYSYSDGTYITVIDGKVNLYGEAFLISEGKVSKISNNNEIIVLK